MLSTLNELVTPYSGPVGGRDEYYAQHACRIFTAYAGALMVFTQEGAPVIRLRSHNPPPSWCSGCSNFLFV
eukprot:1906821-Alexandrium_andersonii.AAC.1